MYSVRWNRETEMGKTFVKFACGTEHTENSFGMWAGPFDTLEDALNEFAIHPKDCLIGFTADGEDKVLYRAENGEWVKQ